MGKRININKMKKKRNKHIYMAILLFIFCGAFVILCSVKFASSLFIETNINNVDKVNNNIQESEKNNLKPQHEASKNESIQESDIEDVTFLEKYLKQQQLGKIPDGVDGKKVVYLTFDDGPSETVTPKILDILKKENIKATFFVLGSSIDSSEGAKNILKREALEGHAIGNHTYSHDYRYLYPNRIVNVENFMSDIEKTNMVLKSVLGKDFSTRVIRFPGGYTSWADPNGIDKALNEKGYYHIDWNSLSKDAEGGYKSSKQLVNEVKETVSGKQKAVILMHDNYGKEETAKALPEIISYLKSNGYKFKIIK